MQYKIFRLSFSGGVHFGKSSLEKSEISFCADTLCSALFQEAFRKSEETGSLLYTYLRSGRLLLSDAFPYTGDEYYLPKPFMQISSSGKSGDSAMKKAYKKLKFIPASELEQYLTGQFDVAKKRGIDDLGFFDSKVSAAVRGEEETLPYRVGLYYFHEGNGLYILAGYSDADVLALLEELLECLSFSGIGGKRAAGLGRFELQYGTLPGSIAGRLDRDGNAHMSLSISLPTEDELGAALEQAWYQLIKRSGFVASPAYAFEQRRKRDLYMLSAGSVFSHCFQGDIYDVSDGGQHPVYRYGRSMFLQIGL